MLALEIRSMKNFMNHLLIGDTFDCFLLEEATISTANTYTIDGHINADFFPPEERGTDCIPYEFQPWKEIKGLCFDLIKGKHTPLFFKFVLYLKPEKAEILLQQAGTDSGAVRALALNIRYDGTKATLTTGTAYRTFTMDKSADQAWDQALLRYLTGKEISFEQL